MLETTSTLHPLCKIAAVQPVRGPGRRGGGCTPKLLGLVARADHIIGVKVGNDEGGATGLRAGRWGETDRMIVLCSFAAESQKIRVKLLRRVPSKPLPSFLRRQLGRRRERRSEAADERDRAAFCSQILNELHQFQFIRCSCWAHFNMFVF